MLWTHIRYSGGCWGGGTLAPWWSLTTGPHPPGTTVPRDLHGILWPPKYLNGYCVLSATGMVLSSDGRLVPGEGRGAKPAPGLQGPKMKQLSFPRAEQKAWKSGRISAALIYLLRQSFTLWVNKKGIFVHLLKGFFWNKSMVSWFMENVNYFLRRSEWKHTPYQMCCSACQLHWMLVPHLKDKTNY